MTACSINVNIMHIHLTATCSNNSSDIKHYQQNTKNYQVQQRQKNGIIKYHASTDKKTATCQDGTATQTPWVL